MSLPTDAKARKNLPIMTGVLDYFPDALRALAALPVGEANDSTSDVKAGWLVDMLMERGASEARAWHGRPSVLAFVTAVELLQTELTGDEDFGFVGTTVEALLREAPEAFAAIAAVSKAGNDQHNPGQPLHHARGKSADHADTAVRHLMERGTVDTDGQRHMAKCAWRCGALAQEELERDLGLPMARGAKAAP